MKIFRTELAFGAGAHRRADTSIGALFLENTKVRRHLAAPGPAESDYDLAEIHAMSNAYKRYRQRPKIELLAVPLEREWPSVPETIRSRRTRRAFATDELTLTEVSSILQLAYGITGHARLPGGGRQPFRAAPSAGALYPAELYLAVRNVSGIEAGIYHYEVPDNQLAQLSAGDPGQRLAEVCCGQQYPQEASLTVIISAVIQRTIRKYGDRGYRYVLLDVGHLGQNLYLICTALGLSLVTTCGFYDDEAAELLGIDGCDEAVLYVGFIGRSQSPVS